MRTAQVGAEDTILVTGSLIVEHFKDVDLERPRELWVPDDIQYLHNLITDIGDQYFASAVARSLGPSGVTTQPSPFPNGMKLGTGTTAVAKNGAGAAATGTFVSGSNLAFDSGFSTTSNLGAGLGVNSQLKTTWVAGVATSATINEVMIVADQATAANASAANTFSRSVFGSTINKGALDIIAVTWNWKFLGA